LKTQYSARYILMLSSSRPAHSNGLHFLSPGFCPADHRVQLVDGAADTIRAAGLKTATRVGESKVVADALMT
jgi:uncharacterized membrane-anchored protein